MKGCSTTFVLLLASILVGVRYADAGQAPASVSDPDIPISHRDCVYTGDQFSNTVSVIDPVDNALLGAIHLGDPIPGNLSPLYKGQLLVHGLGFSPDHRTIAAVAIGSNAVSSTSPMSDALRMKRSSPETAVKYGLSSAARTMSRCWTALHTKRRRGSPFPTVRA